MKRILQITGGALNRNDGITNFVMNVYRHMDRSKYQFDFLALAGVKGHYDKEVEGLGGRIYYVERLGKNLIKHMQQTYEIMSNGGYLAIHRHTAESLSWPDFYIAKKAGISNRICHSHGTYSLKPLLHQLCYPLFYRNITHKLACGIEAGKWLYRKNDNFFVQKNGIETEKFQFDMSVREEQRNRLQINKDALVIGNVGRLSTEKNQMFLLDIFSEVFKRRKNCHLIFLGEGNLEAELKRQAKLLGIADNVLFPGVSNDVPKWLCAMDIAVYPSLNEGFPIAVLEGEASGLPTIISKKIPMEVDILGNLIPISLKQDKTVWAEAILAAYEKAKGCSREGYCRQIRKAGYDIKHTVKELEEFYDKLR